MKKVDNFPSIINCDVCVIGLGYVGLPIAIELSKTKICKFTGVGIKRNVIGFDTSEKRLKELRSGIDITKQHNNEEIFKSGLKILTSDQEELINSDVFIITVPTPIDSANQPDLRALKKASKTIGETLLKRNKDSSPFIIYESTVFPGATEEICIPIIENISGLRINKDFYCGFSPERINPGDKYKTLDSIIKVTSGSNEQSSKWIDNFYKSIISAGTYKAESIKVAEAAKIIENTQRDLNIALVNELSMIFNNLGIDTLNVLKAAETKWNFIRFKPGLVGGHCIGVDPYYLTYKSQIEGYLPEIVLAGRRINDGMPKWIVERLIISMVQKGMVIRNANILVLGISFKENCTDLRNTKVKDVINFLKIYKTNVDIVDPYINKDEAKNLFNIKVTESASENKKYSAVIVCVAHDQFQKYDKKKWMNFIEEGGIIFDLKGIVPEEIETLRL